jgi:hypothetical protein
MEMVRSTEVAREPRVVAVLAVADSSAYLSRGDVMLAADAFLAASRPTNP